MDKILIVASSEKMLCSIKALVSEQANNLITCTDSGSQARRLILEEDWDIVIVNHPLLDDDAERFIQMVNEHSDASTILLVKSEYLNTITKNLDKTLAILVEKPVTKQVFMQAMHLAKALQIRLKSIKKTISKLEAQLEDQKYINRAKIMLITNEHITEEEAHHKLERISMDNRVSKREAAKMIIRLYSD